MTPRLWSTLAAIGLLYVLTALPDQLNAMAWLRPAPELGALILAAFALGRTVAGTVLRVMVTVILGSVTVLKIADLVMLESLGRRYNPVADLPLIDALVRLIAGSVGTLAAAGAVIGAVLTILLITCGLWWATGVLLRLAPDRPWQRGTATTATIALIAVMMTAPVSVLTPQTAGYAADRAQLAGRTVTQLRRFRQEAAEDSLANLVDPLALIDRDVLVIFLESYGRTSFDTPYFADVHLPRLRQGQQALQDQGLTMASGFVTSPTHGGQSWLAHGTLANGLQLTDQARYQAAIASGRQTLFHYAAGAGFRTAAVMPAIVRPWPESLTMGFHSVLAAPDLGYRGQPFNWVTMPDQFTLTAIDRMLRNGDDPRRLFAQVALISSHAPWTPVPQMLDWDDIGDGTEFNAMATAGDPPNVVWRDRDRVRAQYRDSIDYTLQAVLEYAERHANDPPLILLIGDHQAATPIGLDDRREVPMHIIGPADLVARTMDWGLTPGLIPAPDSPAILMDSLRDRFLRNFSGPGDVPPV